MKTHVTSLLFGLSVLSLTALAGCAADASAPDDDALAAGGQEEAVGASEDAISGAPSNYGYFIVTRPDLRRCIAPLCGGFYVKRVNEATTACADGSKKAECYVASITFKGMGLSAREESDFRAKVEAGHALVKARTYKTKWNGVTLGTLKASEGWASATDSVDGSFDGTFYRAGDNGIRCITAPCPSTSATALNGKDAHDVIAVHLDDTDNPAEQSELDRATTALATKEGVLVAGGVALPKCVPGSSCGAFLNASDFYLKVTRTEGKGCGSRGGQLCGSGQYCAWKDTDICGAFDAGGTCTYKPEFCPQVFQPVCACDGQTYSNGCMAAAAGFSVSSEGACAK